MRRSRVSLISFVRFIFQPCEASGYGHTHLMKSFTIFVAYALASSALVSCGASDDRRGGGPAFDDSELGRKLDANSHLPDPDNPSGQSFDQWRQANR